MENRDYKLGHLRRKLFFPLCVDTVGVRPRNNDAFRNARVTEFYISFLWNSEPPSGNKDVEYIGLPFFGVVYPGDLLNIPKYLVRNELFFSYCVTRESAEVFKFENGYFEITPRMLQLRETLMTTLEHIEQPGEADNVDLLALAMAREAMLHRYNKYYRPMTTMPDNRVIKVARKIELNFDDKSLKIDRLIAKSGLGTRNFYREWEKKYTDSPKQYLMKLRFDKAQELLRSSSERIADIAEICGFDSVAYFVRLFRKKFGMTPGDYRKKSRGPAIPARGQR